MSLGQPSVDTMLRQMSAKEFDEWVAFYSLEPFGPYVEDVHFGKLMAVIANAHSAKRRNYQPKDFMVAEPMKRIRRVQTTEEMLAIAEKVNLALGGKDLRRG